ncbi:MAG: PAS domain S-box protein [Candidatus Aminicenantes bacterium]|nr:PAS domain S-box protein [Candidatus Aminicenantes bacterium]
MKNQTVVTAQVIGEYCVSPLVFEDNAGAEQILAKLADVPSIVKARVYDHNLELFASFISSEEPGTTSPIVLEHASEFVDNYLHVYQPILYKNEHYGTIYIQASTQLLRAKIKDNLRYMVFLMAGLTAVSILLAIYLQRIISKPILNLAGVARKITEEENYSIRVKKKGHDEIGLLYDGFNNMLDQIQKREIERDKAEDALRESEKKFRTLTSNIPGAVYRYGNDPDWTVDFISDFIEEISGYEASDFIQSKARTYASIIHPDDKKMVQKTIHDAISKRVPYIIEYRIIRSNDNIRWVYEKGQGIFSDDGMLLWLDGAIFDINERKQAELELAEYKEHLEELVETRTIELTNTNKQLQQEIVERKQAEEALRESEERYRMLFESSPEGILVADIETKEFKYANPAICRMFGYTEDEFKRMSVPDIHPKDALDHVISEFEAQARGEKILAPSIPCLVKDGKIIYTNISTTQALIDGRECNVGFFTDITEIKEMDEALRESEERFRDVALSISDWVWEIDNKGHYTYCSERVVDVLGYTAEEILGKTPFELMPSDEAIRIKKILKKIVKNQEPIVDLESWNINRQGQEVCLQTNGVPMFDKDGNFYGYRGVDKDITEHKRAEETLRKSEGKYRSLIANIPDVTWTTDSEGKTVFISPNIERVYGYTQKEIYKAGDRLWLKRIHPDDVKQVKASYELLFKRKERFDVEYRIQRKDGQWIWLHDRAIGTYKKDDVMYADGVFSDITERVRAQEELKDIQTQLVQSEKMASLGMLVAGVAHEINTPVGAVSSMYDTLVRAVEELKLDLDIICARDPSEQKKVKKLFKIIEDANKVIASGTERVTNIVRRLKSFARLDEVEIRKVDIHEGIEDTLTIVYHELKHKAVVMRNFGNIPPISCNPSQLNQVFLNLLINAVQAIKNKGVITITTFQKDGQVHVQFKDTGVGIPKEAMKKIFDPGYTTKGVGVGTGLGLSICYQIIKDHHGEILVESEVGQGSKFTVVLPIKPSA